MDIQVKLWVLIFIVKWWILFWKKEHKIIWIVKVVFFILKMSNKVFQNIFHFLLHKPILNKWHIFFPQRYHLKDVIVGKIYFLLVRIKIQHMELQLIKKEITGIGKLNWNSYISWNFKVFFFFFFCPFAFF